MRAAIYARYSTDEQREASIEDQKRGCERIVAANDFDLVGLYDDRGVSGGTHQRPGYQAMLTDARADKFDVIVTEDISRLWRNRAEYGARSAELEDLGIHCVTCVGDDTRRDGWGLVLGIKQAIAEHARREISYRTRRGLEGKALAGGSTGGRCYGYRNTNTLEPIEAPRVKCIFEARCSGQSVQAIAYNLNQLHWKSPRGGQWRASTVAAILANPRYTGAVRWGATESKGSAADSARKTRRKRPEELVIVRRDERLRIVSDKVWVTAQAVRLNKKLAIVAPTD